MREVYTWHRRDTEGVTIPFALYMVDGFLNLIPEGSSKVFIRIAEPDVAEGDGSEGGVR